MTETNEEIERRRWKNRRRIAYTGLWSGTAVVVIMIVLSVIDINLVANLGPLAPILSTYIFGVLALPGAYMGLSTWKDIKGTK